MSTIVLAELVVFHLSSVVPRSVSCELEGFRLCPGRFPWLQFQWSLPQRHTTLPAGACLSVPARGLRVNPREWFQVVRIRLISVPFSVVCLVDGYDYTRSTNIAQAGLMKALETLGFIGVSRSAYRAYSRRVSGAARTRQAGHGARTCGQIGRARQGGRDGHGAIGGRVAADIGADVVRGTRLHMRPHRHDTQCIRNRRVA